MVYIPPEGQINIAWLAGSGGGEGEGGGGGRMIVCSS